MTHVQLNGRHRRQLFVEAVNAKTLSSEDFDHWDKARKAANAVNRRDCRPELIAAKDQAELSARTVCNAALEQGSRVELNTEDILEVAIEIKSDTGAIRAKQEEDSQLLRGFVDQVSVITGVVAGGVMPQLQPGQDGNDRIRALRNSKRFQDTQISFLRENASPTEALRLAGENAEKQITAAVEAKAAKAKVTEDAKAANAKVTEEAKAAKGQSNSGGKGGKRRRIRGGKGGKGQSNRGGKGRKSRRIRGGKG